MINLTEKAQQIYQQNKQVGWWDDPNRCILTVMQLISTEIAEATEGERKNLMDDHLPHRRMGEVELADALIRTLDLAGRFDMSIRLTDIFVDKGMTVAAHHAIMTSFVGDLVKWYRPTALVEPTVINRLVSYILRTGDSLGYDIISAMEEKLVYNQERLDHKRENRAADGGKKF